MTPFARKLPSADEQHRLLRCLSALDLTSIGVGNMIGTGIFVLTGIAAATQAGPALILSFVFAGIACAFVGFAYAELAASVGGCGGAYSYAYAAFGELPAWMAGWNLIFSFASALAAVANGWSGYFAGALQAMGAPLPFALANTPTAGGWVNLPATLIILVLMITLMSGVKQSARVNRIVVAAKLLALAVFLAVAVFHLRPALWHPFMPYGWFSRKPDGSTAGVLAAASVVFFAYRGFQTVSFAVEEAEHPQRDVPFGILGSLALCTALYLAVAGALTGIAPYGTLNVASPMAFALFRIGYNWGSALVAAGVIIGLTSTMLMIFYALTRIIFAISRDGLMPPFFSRLGGNQTPVNAILVCGIVMSVVAGLVPLATMAQLVNASTLTEFILVCAGVIVLRHRSNAARPFRAPGGILAPLLGIASCTALLNFLPPAILIRYAGWLAAGLVIYFVYAGRKSSARRTLGQNPL